ncbi:maestro heat-like repeat family member 5 [Strigops habroptila]|uniref:maestro heat-like repeat family member 5 n=1 Tax=Strigops habroptila TaxID=2489341 RepID=UPI0011CFC54C|nr:maestro heat-like repeat family member 5 [Strigops habroptila]XP_030330844.1 maestro heat-like repeat family member 5 [Strigops habroptila]
MGHLLKKEASPIAVQLVGDLLPLFDGESSQLRELSIRLFRVLLDSVVRSDKRRMRSSTRGFLVPLFLHMSDQSDSVAEASREALLASATLLGWRELQHLLKTRQTWRIAECLLERSRKRAEEYLDQSVPYLEDAQAPLREAAIRFIGLAARPLRGRNELKLEQICRALETLPEESDPVICSLAIQTVLILRRPPVRRTLGWRLRALCC